MFRRWYDLDRDLFFGASAFEDLHRQINELFDRTSGVDRGRTGLTGTLYDAGEEFVLQLMAPGLRPEDLDLSLHDNVLTLKAERTPEAPEGYESVRRERAQTRWNQSIRLPAPTDPERVRAELNDGILRVHIAKRAEASPRQIQVTAS